MSQNPYWTISNLWSLLITSSPLQTPKILGNLISHVFFFLLLFWLLSCLPSKLRGSTPSVDLFSVLSGFASYPLQLFWVNTWGQARFVLQRKLSHSVVFKWWRIVSWCVIQFPSSSYGHVADKFSLFAYYHTYRNVEVFEHFERVYATSLAVFIHLSNYW